MSTKRDVPEFRDREVEDHEMGCGNCKEKIPEVTDPGFVICRIYVGKIRKVTTGCSRHRCDQCPPSAQIDRMVQTPIVKVQKTLGEI
jgi:hypothetical protein